MSLWFRVNVNESHPIGITGKNLRKKSLFSSDSKNHDIIYFNTLPQGETIMLFLALCRNYISYVECIFLYLDSYEILGHMFVTIDKIIMNNGFGQIFLYTFGNHSILECNKLCKTFFFIIVLICVTKISKQHSLASLKQSLCSNCHTSKNIF